MGESFEVEGKEMYAHATGMQPGVIECADALIAEDVGETSDRRKGRHDQASS